MSMLGTVCKVGRAFKLEGSVKVMRL